jgi:hypothetical protein
MMAWRHGGGLLLLHGAVVTWVLLLHGAVVARVLLLMLHDAVVAWVLLLHNATPPWRGGGVCPPPPRRSTSTVAVSDLGLAGLDQGSGIFLLLKIDFSCRLT